jgi:glutamate synthase (NADPH/NADH) large chain
MDLIRGFKDNCGFGLLASIDNKATHKNVEDAIIALERMMHRGAIAADGKSGDGSGLLFSMPVDFMKKRASKHNVELPNQFAVGMLFLSDESQQETISEICDQNDLKVLFYAKVPINTEALGKQALETLPKIYQVFVSPNSLMATKRFKALLYLTRREIEKKFSDDKDFYIPSFSDVVVSYKGLVMPTHIKEFYPDLEDEDFKASFALFHQRFSTNTLPRWPLAQPFRTIAHNGEINSVTANRFNLMAKSNSLKSEVFTDKELEKILPITSNDISDSASLDNAFEFLIVNGVDFFKAARALIPTPWQNAPHMDPSLRAFYEFQSTHFEAWDGPAAVSLTDGRHIGCVLDRNGLRPAKYIITKDNRIIISSEFGVVDENEDNIIERGRLQSGEMIGVDLKYGKVLKSKTIDNYLKESKPYAKWLNQNMSYLQEYVELPFENTEIYNLKDLKTKQRFFGVTQEIIDMVIEPMLNDGKEATGSMGDDTPLAAFSTKQRRFTDFFKQSSLK